MAGDFPCGVTDFFCYGGARGLSLRRCGLPSGQSGIQCGHSAVRSQNHEADHPISTGLNSRMAAVHYVVPSAGSRRAAQARVAPGVNVGQPAPKAASELSHEARRSSEECVGSHESHRSKLRTATIRHGLKVPLSFCLVLVIFASHFRARMDLPKTSSTWSPA